MLWVIYWGGVRGVLSWGPPYLLICLDECQALCSLFLTSMRPVCLSLDPWTSRVFDLTYFWGGLGSVPGAVELTWVKFITRASNREAACAFPCSPSSGRDAVAGTRLPRHQECPQTPADRSWCYRGPTAPTCKRCSHRGRPRPPPHLQFLADQGDQEQSMACWAPGLKFCGCLCIL